MYLCFLVLVVYVGITEAHSPNGVIVYPNCEVPSDGLTPQCDTSERATLAYGVDDGNGNVYTDKGLVLRRKGAIRWTEADSGLAKTPLPGWILPLASAHYTLGAVILGDANARVRPDLDITIPSRPDIFSDFNVTHLSTLLLRLGWRKEGEPGKQGSQGPRGQTGDKGDPGQIGPPGAAGPAGDQGKQGVAGPAGTTGTTGQPGPQGPTGNGTQGPQGQKGDPGDQGQGGIKGDTGPAGPAGEQGPRGDSGPSGGLGAKGDTGAPGPQGITGPQGIPGPSAPQGKTGEQGIPGPRGLQGQPGSPGHDGLPGQNGRDGVCSCPEVRWISSHNVAILAVTGIILQLIVMLSIIVMRLYSKG